MEMRVSVSSFRTGVAGLGLIVLSLLSSAAPGQTEETATAPSASGAVAVLVELEAPPAARVYGETLRTGATAARAADAGRVQYLANRTATGALAARLADPGIGGREIYRVARAMNGVAIEVDRSKLSQIGRLPGVKAVHVIDPEYPTNSTSVPFIGAPGLWQNAIPGLPSTLTGAGMRIGIIDTGIDYMHPSFGGTGLLADYQAEATDTAAFTTVGTATAGAFPTARVVGGWDFAGDAYTGGATGTPDPNPMDCGGHGSHVAGTAAGGGVNADGTAYAGPWGPATNFAGLRIGPGVAPQASLYSLRVFGCGGSTSLTVQAIDWSTDPNGDGDLSDRLDVINMSLGSAFGAVTSTSAMASENAALAGVIVVASAGNSGDTYFITGSPGVSGRAISVANIVDSGIAANSIRVNSPAGIAGFYTAGTAAFGGVPPAGGISGNVVVGLDPSDGAGVLTTDGCSPLTNAAAVAGNIALIDRGTCGFAVKVKNAQDAGAIAAIIANSAAGAFGNMGGTDPTITISSVMVTYADGNTFKANIPGLNTTLFGGADTVASSSSRGPRLAGSPIRLKPDLAAPGTSITSVLTGVTCTGTAPSTGCIFPTASGYWAGGQSAVLSGTSMAAPHMAGTMALLRQAHPDWSIEELKALAMNTALHDLTTLPGGSGSTFGPGRIGDGRVDLPLAGAATAVAFNAEDAGLVSVSFEQREVVGATTQQKQIRIVNKAATAQTFDLSIVTTVDAPGVSLSLPGGSSVTVPAFSTVTFPVQMTATAAQMDHAREATVASTQVVTTPGSLANLAIPRHWLTEEAGYVVLSQGGTPKLRVPAYVPPRPASQMAAGTIATGGAPSGSTTIALSGTDVCTGTLGAGPACAGTFPTDVASLVSPFELQVVSPRDPNAAPANADIQYAGVATDGTRIWFGISTWGDWSTPTDVSFTIYVDNNSDGTYDRQVFNTSSGGLSRRFFGGTGFGDTDAFITSVFTPPNLFSNVIAASTPNYVNRLSASSVESVLFNSNVMFIGATPAQLGLASTSTPFRYKIETCPGWAILCQAFSGFHYDEAVGPFSWNGGAQGLDFAGANLLQDLNGASIPVTWNTANMTANGSLGALLLHHHNVEGQRAEVVLLEGAASADLSVALGVAPTNPAFGANATFTLTAANGGTAPATGVSVSFDGPAGITWISDTSGGAFDPGTGIWTVGNLASGANASIQIVVKVASTDPLTYSATIAGTSPLDPNPANNSASVSLQAPRSADVAVSMTAAPASANVGAPLTYTISVTNSGADTAYGLNVSELFPAMPALTPTSFTASQGTFTPATGLWVFPSLGTGVTATLQLTVTAPSFAGALTAQATVGSSTADPVTGNNTASASVTVLSPAAIAGATKTVSGLRFPGAVVTYTIVLPNTGTFDQIDNPGDEFTDVLPATLQLVSASATSGTAVADAVTNTVHWNGSIPAGGSVTISIQARIASTAGGASISNQGTAYFDADGNGTNESSLLTDDPAVGGATDPTAFQADAQAAIPAASTFGLALLGFLTALGAVFFLRSRVG